MFCKYCGNTIPDNTVFCPVCGTASDEGETVMDYSQNYSSYDNGGNQTYSNNNYGQPTGNYGSYDQSYGGYNSPSGGYNSPSGGYNSPSGNYNSPSGNYNANPGYGSGSYSQQPTGYGYTGPEMQSRNKTVGIAAGIGIFAVIVILFFILSGSKTPNGYYVCTTQVGSSDCYGTMIVQNNRVLYITSNNDFFYGDMVKRGSKWYVYPDYQEADYDYYVLYNSGGNLCVDSSDTNRWITDKFKKVNESTWENYLYTYLDLDSDAINTIYGIVNR